MSRRQSHGRSGPTARWRPTRDPLAAITEWRSLHAPWPLDEQVEQDLIISRALVDLFSDPLIAKSLVFRGGTALNKLYFQPAARYSEDIDLVQVVPGEIGPILSAIRERLAWLGEAKRKASQNMATLTFRFETEAEPVSTRKLKVEINTREHFSVEDLVRVPLAVTAPSWDGYSGSAEIVTYTFEELLGTKLRALYERRKGRDVFDLAYALQRDPAPDRGKILASFARYTDNDKGGIALSDFSRTSTPSARFPATSMRCQPSSHPTFTSTGRPTLSACATLSSSRGEAGKSVQRVKTRRELESRRAAEPAGRHAVCARSIGKPAVEVLAVYAR